MLEGMQFGEWVVLKQVKVQGSSARHFECKCSCGTIKTLRADMLKQKRSTRCRACRDKDMYHDPNEFLNKKFGRYLVLKQALGNHSRSFECQCECGKITIISASILKNNKSKSCQRCNVLIHGMDGTPTYRSWLSMKKRCTDPKWEGYYRYGGRGITFHESWNNFVNFFKDMGIRPKGKQLDRINNNGNYEPGNVKWSTPKENSNNRNKRVSKSDNLTLTLT